MTSSVPRFRCSRIHRAQTRSEYAYAFLLIGLALPSAAPCAERLRGQLVELAANHNFAVKGLERLDEEPAKLVVGNLRVQVSLLLRDYDFVIIEDGQGGIRELWIFGRQPARPKRPTRPRGEHTVKTTRRGSHHYVEAVLRGPSSQAHRSPFLIDTGASTVVLPASMIETLGFRGEDLREGWAQTAAGRIAAKGLCKNNLNNERVIRYT